MSDEDKLAAVKARGDRESGAQDPMEGLEQMHVAEPRLL